MEIEIINTGSELMLGRVLNTHQQWLCRQLSDAGYLVNRQVAVADTAPEIKQAVREALSRADLIICTGGLGPTADDLTRTGIAELLGKPLLLDPSVLARIKSYFTGRGRAMPESAAVQALVPEGCQVVPNAHGTAPGLIMDTGRNQFRADGLLSHLVLLPGPPRELYPMFTAQVLPWIRQIYPEAGNFHSRTLKTTGFGESVLEERVAPALQVLVNTGLELGYCARIGEVEIRIAMKGPQAHEILDQAEALISKVLGGCIFGRNEDRLEEVVVRLLTERTQTVALAESCTGGLIAHRLTNVPGASAVFMAGLVTYSNEAKHRCLGVPNEMIANHGAVSEPVARAMAEGARQRNGTDYGLAVTGIAGPTGGSEAKPVGTVYIALATARETTVKHHLNLLDRESFKQATSQQALDMLRQSIPAGLRGNEGGS